MAKADIHVFRLAGYALTNEQKERLREASATLKRLRKRRRKVVKEVDAGGLTSWLADGLFQHALHRIVMLADGVVAEWNSARPTNAIVLARSLLETVASWNYVGGRVLKLAEREDIRDIHQILLRMRFGIRHKLTEADLQFPASTNVLTFIGSLEKPDALLESMEVFAPTDDGRKVFRYYYDEMSEFVHPNEAGIGVFGQPIDSTKMELHLSENQPATEPIVLDKILHVTILLSLAEKFLDAYENSIRALIISLESKFGRHPSEWPAAKAK